MTTPRPTPFPATTPRARVLILFIIISDSNDEITTLAVRPAPPSSDRTPALSAYPLDSCEDLSDKDWSETIESLHTQTAPTSVVDLPLTRPLSTSPAFAHRPGKEIPTSTPSLLPSSSSPPSLLPSSSSPPPLLLPSSSRKRSRSPTSSLPSSVSPSPLPSPPPPAVPPPPEHIELVGDDIETLRANFASAIPEMMTLRVRVGLLKQHNVVRELQKFWVTDILKIIKLRIRAEYAKSCLEQSHERQTRDRARLTDMTGQDIETLHAMAEAAEQRAETRQVSLGAARMDVRDLIEFREADKLEMAELRGRAQDIEASF
ncbi:hypothetical protein Tco_0873564 [Tanacetum coccineum]|uniref:Uncharacterized protein n=1 Tax=Tanacetum coccineum TaxID=301880 RepID=A0ABQ5BK02_9ASTR